MHEKETEALLSALKENPKLMGISGQLRIDCAKEKLLESMRESHFSGLYFGIESPNEQTLRKIGKPNTRTKIIKTLARAKMLGFDLAGAFTIGYPWETEADILNTLDFARNLKKEFELKPSVYIVTPFPNTPLSKLIPDNQIKIRDYELWDAKHAIMDTDYLSRECIQELYDSFI